MRTDDMTQREWVDKDFYAILGVASDASGADIKKAYRKLAQRYHPDANPGDREAEEKFKEISQAYDTLGDERKRREYDQMRQMLRSGFGRFRSGGQDVRFEDLSDIFGGGFTNVEDLFGGMFGQRGRGPRSSRGQDLQSEVSLGFTEALEGVQLQLSVDDPTRGARSIKVRIPAGVTDGAKIKIPGKGTAGQGNGPPGDLYVLVHVKPHPVFGRRGKDLTIKLPVTFTEAALGAQVEVPTLDGKVMLKIPAGTSNGKTFRIKGKGPLVDGNKRDVYVTVDIAVPTKLTKEQKDLLESFRRTEKGSPRDQLEELGG